MSLAPLDVWARLAWEALRHGSGGVGARVVLLARYGLRWALALFMSSVSTVVTMPERVVLWPVLRVVTGGRRGARVDRGPSFAHGPGVVCVLGYFRSGTTHLHYVLSADRRFVTPTWAQAMVPHGFWLSWFFFRFAMVPFVPNSRPQDDVAIGPDWPAEDDFALANWCLASSLPGRFVFPSRAAWWQRWHFLEGLSGAELDRFRRALAGFCWKITRGRAGRVLLLKTPSHTARVAELERLFGQNVRYIHIAREPGAVIRSNAAMFERLSGNLLEDAPTREHVRRGIVEEYVRTERAFAEQAAAVPAERLVRVRYADLIASPMQTLRDAYERLGLGWTAETERAFAAYLDANAGYRAAGEKAGSAGERGSKASAEVAEPDERERAVCDELRELFERGVERAAGDAHHRVGPTQARARFGAAGRSGERPAWWACAMGPIAAAVCFGVWMGVTAVTRNRLDTLVWVYGTVIGWAVVRAAGKGTARLGWWAALWFAVMVGASVWPLPYIENRELYDSGVWTVADRVANIRSSYLNITSNWLYIALGAVAAWRFASRAHLRPPGR